MKGEQKAEILFSCVCVCLGCVLVSYITTKKPMVGLHVSPTAAAGEGIAIPCQVDFEGGEPFPPAAYDAKRLLPHPVGRYPGFIDCLHLVS